MTISDDLRTAAKKELTLGTAHGEPYAYDSVVKKGYRFGDPRLQDRIVGQYIAEHDRVPGDTHVKACMSALRTEALGSGPLPADAVAEIPAPPPPAARRGSGLRRDVPPGGIVLGNDVAVVEEVLRVLQGRDDVFLADMDLTRVSRDENGKARLESMELGDDLAAWCHINGITFWYEIVIDEITFYGQDFLPVKIGKQVLRWHNYENVMPVVGISRIPLIAPDGSVVSANGYNASSRMYMDIDEDLLHLTIPDNPGPADVAAASALIQDVYSGFAWADSGSLANAIGLALTAGALKGMYPEMLVPVHAVVAAQQGSGKTVIGAELPGVMSGGYAGLTFAEDEPEMRKAITSALMNNSERVLCFDNVVPGVRFESGVVAKVVTNLRHDDRVLGTNRHVSLVQDRVWTVTGNNLQVGPDMAARTVPIMLEAVTDRPAAREFEVRLDDAEVLMRMRPDLVTAVLTIVRAWVQAGMPLAPPSTMRQFTSWAGKCGGILLFMGIDGFLTNTEALIADDENIHAMAMLYEAMALRFGGESFVTADVVDMLSERPDLDEHLPSWIADKMERELAYTKGSFEEVAGKLTVRSTPRVRRSVGNTFKNRVGQFYGGLQVVKSGTDRMGFGTWKLRSAPSYAPRVDLMGSETTP